MKLWLQGTSVRLRLTRSEVGWLRDTGLVKESVEFSGGERLAYSLGRLWLKDGKLPPEGSARLLMLPVQLRDLYRHHLAIEDAEVFPAAVAALSGSDRLAIGSEMATRRGVPAP